MLPAHGVRRAASSRASWATTSKRPALAASASASASTRSTASADQVAEVGEAETSRRFESSCVAFEGLYCTCRRAFTGIEPVQTSAPTWPIVAKMPASHEHCPRLADGLRVEVRAVGFGLNQVGLLAFALRNERVEHSAKRFGHKHGGVANEVRCGRRSGGELQGRHGEPRRLGHGDHDVLFFARMAAAQQAPPSLAAITERVDKTWEEFVRAVVYENSPDDASKALRDFQGHLDSAYFGQLYHHHPPSYMTALDTLRYFKEGIQRSAARWSAASRAAGALSALVGSVTTVGALLTEDKHKLFVALVGAALVAVGVSVIYVGENRSKRWDSVLKDLDTLLADARKQGPGK